MRQFKLIILLFIVTIAAKSQQLPGYNMYLTNNYLFNPAIAGSEQFTPIRFSSRSQWTGISKAPSTQAISMHSRIGKRNFYTNKGYVKNTTSFDKKGNVIYNKKMGFKGQEAIGCMIIKDRNGIYSFTGIGVTGAFHFRIRALRNRSNQAPTFAIGITPMMYQLKIDESDVNPYTTDDNTLTQAIERDFIPDLNLGLYFYNPDYYFGYSVMNLIESKMEFGGISSGDNKLIKHNFLTAGYKFHINRDVKLETSIFFKSTNFTESQTDYSARVILDRLDIGLTYRTNKNMILNLGVNYNNYYFAYSFEYSNNEIISYSHGSHEITLGINFKKSLMRGFKN